MSLIERVRAWLNDQRSRWIAGEPESGWPHLDEDPQSPRLSVRDVTLIGDEVHVTFNDAQYDGPINNRAMFEMRLVPRRWGGKEGWVDLLWQDRTLDGDPLMHNSIEECMIESISAYLG